LLRRSRHAVRAASRSSCPSPRTDRALRRLSPGRHGPASGAPLSGSRPSRALRENQPSAGVAPFARRAFFASFDPPLAVTDPLAGRRSAVADNPPGLLFPSALAESGIRSSRAFASPATVRPRRFSRPRRFPPPETSPGLLHPGNALGIRPSGAFPSGDPHPSRGRSSLAVPRPEHPRRHPNRRRLQRFPLSGSPYHWTDFEARANGRSPPGLCPSRALPSSAAGSVSRPFLSCASSAATGRPRPTGASECQRAEDPAFPACAGAGPSGVRHLLRRSDLATRPALSVAG